MSVLLQLGNGAPYKPRRPPKPKGTRKKPKFDAVKKPEHYTKGRKYEPLSVLLDWFPTDPLLWQVGKYISRAGRKGPALQDLQKAKFYLERAIEREAAR